MAGSVSAAAAVGASTESVSAIRQASAQMRAWSERGEDVASCVRNKRAMDHLSYG